MHSEEDLVLFVLLACKLCQNKYLSCVPALVANLCLLIIESLGYQSLIISCDTLVIIM